jgi:hypothetical protein
VPTAERDSLRIISGHWRHSSPVVITQRKWPAPSESARRIVSGIHNLPYTRIHLKVTTMPGECIH